MGTVMTHKVYGQDAKESLEAVCREITRIEALFSRFLPDSDISRVNRSAGIRSEKVSPETYNVLKEAHQYSNYSKGKFDVTIGPLVNVWGKSKESCTPPDESSIRQLLPFVNYHDLILSPRRLTAGLRHAGQSIDVGGLGKGFTGDKVREIFNTFGITSAYSNFGGNVVTLGAKPDGSPWLVGIQHPRKEEKVIGTVAVANCSVVTSGDYQRYITDSSGRRYHHILDPTTGFPSESGLISVSVVTESSLQADLLSTSVFITGMKTGHELLRRFPRTEAVLVDSALHVYITQGLKDRFRAEKDIAVTILQ
jgi:thiamine biosynthesis lipoprotein